MNDMVGLFMFIKNTRKASGMVVKKISIKPKFQYKTFSYRFESN